MGCTQKSGSAPVRGVLSYGEPVREKGLNLLSAPGNDLVASTALGGFRGSYSSCFHRTGNAFRLTGSDREDIHQQPALR